MKKNLLHLAISTSLLGLPLISYADSPYFSLNDGEDFKRFSVSVGVMHVMPQGKAQPIRVNTAVKEGEVQAIGEIDSQTVEDNLKEGFELSPLLKAFLNSVETIPASLSGTGTIYGIESWENPGTGIEADNVTTLGIMANYFFTDHISLELKAGLPPTVDLKGKGEIYAPFSAVSEAMGGIAGEIQLENNIFITDLSAIGNVGEGRAWTPALELQYHFGKTGVNKFRPYVGIGLIYAYFDNLKLDSALEQELIDGGHKIANIKNGAAGAALEDKTSTANPIVKLDADDVFAPSATVGFTYDFNDRWFAVGSVSYAHLTSKAEITVRDEVLGELISATADIEINPILGYVGVGYRF